MKVGDKVWHPKTKLVGVVAAPAGTRIEVPGAEVGTFVPEHHLGVAVLDPLGLGPQTYVWAESSLELLDEEEFKVVSDLTNAKRRKTELNKEVEKAKSEFGRAEEAMLEFLNRMAVQGTRQYAGVGQVTIDGVEVHASITEEAKPTAFREIREMGRGEIIKETIHPATLDSFVSELKDTGVPVPKSISVFERPKLSFAKKK
mgnify:CR=1 FL=1